MNITELDQYNLSDAVKFNQTLNPRLWDDREQMRPEVREALLRIAEDFREFLGVNDLQLKDITVSGSNAAYTYTPGSDIDLHLVVDMPEQNADVYQELFNAKKFQYNNEHDIKIGNADVELYVQPSDQPHHSQGIFSIKNNQWKSVPQRRKIAIDDQCVIHKTEDLQQRIDSAIESGSQETMQRLWDKIKNMRQTGLESAGEFGCDNLVFKMLRKSGHIEQLKQAKLSAHDQALSLDERRRKKSKVKYGWGSFGGYWYPGTAYAGQDQPAGSEGSESVKESVDTESAPQLRVSLEQIVSEFVTAIQQELGIQKLPTIKLRRDPEWTRRNGSFGRYDPDANVLYVATAGRHVLDVLRTLAHELTHRRQDELENIPDWGGETGSRFEDEANAMAGRIMRHLADRHPEYFADIELVEGASGYIPKNKKEARMPQYAMALSVDIGPGQTGTEANKLGLKTGPNGEPGLLMKSTNLLKEYQEFKSKQPRRNNPDLNDPLGPETPPTMPAGTVRVDVSDMYDWYKLGQHISNMKGLGKHDFGAGPPSSIFSFGSEELEHDYIKDLEATGLTTTDIDPRDPKQPADIPRQKTDPTYNVSEEEVEEVVNIDTASAGFKDQKDFGDYLVTAKGADVTYSPGRGRNKLYVSVIDKKTNKEVAWADFIVQSRLEDGEKYLESMYTRVKEEYRGKGLAKLMYQYANSLGNDIQPSTIQTPLGKDMWKGLSKSVKQLPKIPEPKPNSSWWQRMLAKKPTAVSKKAMAESFDRPYKLKWEKSDHGDYDALATLDDGTYLSIMFNNEYKNTWMVEFYRNNSQEVTGEGDAQRIFATVLAAIGQFIQKRKPASLFFSAVKEDDPKGSRARLYNSLVARYATKLGYSVTTKNDDQGMSFKLTRMPQQGVTEGKIKLSTDPNWYGAEVGDYLATGPVVNISAAQLVGFEPNDKMKQPKSKANVEKIVAGLKKGDKLPPLLVRKYKKGYQVLDGHHRFWAYKSLGIKSIPVQIVPAKDIEEISKQTVKESDAARTAKSAIDQTEVFGVRGYRARCLEPGCEWHSRSYDRIKQAQDSAKKHAAAHIKPGVTEGFDKNTVNDLLQRIRSGKTIVNLSTEDQQTLLSVIEDAKQKLVGMLNSDAKLRADWPQVKQYIDKYQSQILMTSWDAWFGSGTVKQDPQQNKIYLDNDRLVVYPAMYNFLQWRFLITFLTNRINKNSFMKSDVDVLLKLKSLLGINQTVSEQGVTEGFTKNLDTDYFMNEGCGIFAVAMALSEPGSQIYIISNKSGESWSKSFPYEITHVFVNVPNKGQYDVHGQRSIEAMAHDFGLSKGDYGIKGPFVPKEFFTKFMGSSDNKPLYGTVKDVKELQQQIQNKQGVTEDELVESLRREFELLEDEFIGEIKMSPSNLRAEAAKTGAIAGMEFEMIVPGVKQEDPEPEPNIDDFDESCRSIDSAVEFFHDGDYNGRREVERLRERMEDDFSEWLMEKIDKDWAKNPESYIYQYLVRNVDAATIGEIIGEDLSDADGPTKQQVSQAAEIVNDNEQQPYYDDARDWHKEEYQDAWDESDWLDDADLDRMSAIYNNYDITWPHWNYNTESAVDIDTVANDFSEAVGMPVNASQQYHGGRREAGHYVVEPDGSLRPDSDDDEGLEFVSPPMPIDQMLDQLKKVREWAGRNGCYTNDSTGLHINVSVPEFSNDKLDYVKLALLLGDQYVLDQFGRSSNTYTKSALSIVQDRVRTNPKTAQAMLDRMRGHMEDLATKAIHSGETSKYTSINTKEGYIEFRSPGGDWLDENFDKVENTLLRFTVALKAAMDPEAYREEYLKKLYKLLEPTAEGQKGSDTVRYFADYVAGKIPAAALRSFVKQAQLQRKIAKEPAGGKKYWWRVYKDGQDARNTAMVEVVASSEREAIDKAAAEFGVFSSEYKAYMDAVALRPYVETETEYEIIQVAGNRVVQTFRAADDNAALAYFDRTISAGDRPYYDVRRAGTGAATEPAAQQPAGGFEFELSQTDIENRLGLPDQTGDANYEVFNRNTQRPVFVFIANTAADASRKYLDWLAASGLPNDTEDYGFRERARPGSTLDLQRTRARQTSDQQQGGLVDVATDAGQNANQNRQFTGVWLILDPDGNVIHSFAGVGNVQSDANRVAIQWLRQNPGAMQAGVTVVPEMI